MAARWAATASQPTLADSSLAATLLWLNALLNLLWRSSFLTKQELMEGGDLRSRNAEVNEWGLRRFGWYQR